MAIILQKSKPMNFTRIWFLSLGTFLLFSCSEYRVVTDDSFNQKYYNLNYGDNNDSENLIDVFIPKERKDSVFVLLIHGGGWRFGSKGHMRQIQDYLLKEGIACGSMNYRLANDSIHYKQQLQDVEQAVNYVKDSLNEKGDFILLGESAGGHLALLYAYQNPKEITKVISFSGPTDFYSKKLTENHFYHRISKSAFSRATGDTYELGDTIPKSFVKASPISQVSNVPTLIFQGTADMFVNKNQGLALDSALTAKKIEHELVLIKGANHTPRFMPWWRNQVIFPKMMNFINGNSSS